MGFYIECPDCKGKAKYLIDNFGAEKLVLMDQIEKSFREGHDVVCVVDNGMFEAAAFCYSLNEINAFCDPTDFRPKTWLKLPKGVAAKLSGYSR